MKVLGIGSGIPLTQDVRAAGADLCEFMPASPGGTSVLDHFLGSPRKEFEGTLQVRSLSGVELAGGDWDKIVLGDMTAAEIKEILPRAHRAARDVIHARGSVILESDSKVAAPAAPTGGQEIVQQDRAERSVMLHVHNVRRCGGTGNFVLDLARCFPEFQHVALCVNDAAGDPAWVQAVSPHMRTFYAPVLTKELLEEINPRFVNLHATTGKHLGTGDPKKDNPYPWLSDGGRRFVITWHHIGTYPLVPCDLNVFVSEYVKWNKYGKFLPLMKDHAVIPPCTDTRPFANIRRSPGASRLATTAGKGCSEAQEVLQKHSAYWTFDHSPPGKVDAMPGYLAKYSLAVVWSGHQETWCRTVSETMAAGCLTIAHRAGAIPEQITDGKNGFLFDTADELSEILSRVQRMTADERDKIAQVGRDWATRHVSFARMRELFYPYLMRGILST